MRSRLLLDTSAVMLLFAGEAEAQRRLAEAETVFVPSIVLGELYMGARQTGQAEENLVRIEEFALSNTILVCDGETAKIYGLIKHSLGTAGPRIPENDLWIAALAQQYNLTLVTRDSHFVRIKGPRVEIW